jgi:signal transduction histidine kinase
MGQLDQRAILLESEPEAGLLLRTLLERRGLSVLEAGEVGEAARLARTAPAHLVVVDLDGAEPRIDLCRRLRAQAAFRNVPVLAVSAEQGDGFRARAEAVGIDGFVPRPILPSRFDAEVGAAIALRRRLEEEQAVVRAASSRLAAVRDWSAYLVHDLNNPLTIISGTLQLMERDPLTQRQRRALDDALSARGRLERLVRSFLDVERLAGGDSNATVEAPVDLGALLAEVEGAVAGQARLSGCDVRVERRTDRAVSGDAPLLARALINLAENAIRFTRDSEGGVRVVAEDGPLGVRLSVLDAGPGIPPEEREAVFERFVQRGDGRGRGVSGLGLCMSRAVAEQHGGRAWAGESPLGGAAIHIDLPAAD